MRRRAPAVAVLSLATLSAALWSPASAGPVNPSANATTVAVIGDTSYGAAQFEVFPNLVDDINHDPKVRRVIHLGDIKSGSSPCTTEYFTDVASHLEKFRDPVVYTPGDNEWTDCHRPAAGGFDPLDRLGVLRQVFFAEPGKTLGRRENRVSTQADDPTHATFVENVLWVESQVAFATVHVVGSNNGLAPWFGAAETPEQRGRRLAEYSERVGAAVAWIDRTFDLAQENGLEGVVLAMQADMWDASAIAAGQPLDGFTAIVQRIAERAREFAGDVLILQGDSHRFRVDNPLAAGDAVHGVTEPVTNVTRIVVEGETAREWLRLTIDPRGEELFRWERVAI